MSDRETLEERLRIAGMQQNDLVKLLDDMREQRDELTVALSNADFEHARTSAKRNDAEEENKRLRARQRDAGLMDHDCYEAEREISDQRDKLTLQCRTLKNLEAEYEVRIDAALALHYCAFDENHTEAWDSATCNCGAQWTRDGCQSPIVLILKGKP